MKCESVKLREIHRGQIMDGFVDHCRHFGYYRVLSSGMTNVLITVLRLYWRVILDTGSPVWRQPLIFP